MKAYLLCGTCDAPARADFLNHIRFNGKFGCPRCYSIGYNISDENNSRNHCHIYPFEGDLLLRTHQQYDMHGLSAAMSGNPEFGVKSPSILTKLMPDVVRGNAVDIMHCGI